MPIRPLTDDELTQIKAVKQAAKEKLKSMRETLRKQRKGLSNVEKGNLENRIAKLWPPKGKPVIVVVDGEEICLNYELLKKFFCSLDKQEFWYSLKVDGTDYNRKLTVDYQYPSYGNGRGSVDFFELPPRQRDLCQGLPKLEICT